MEDPHFYREGPREQTKLGSNGMTVSGDMVQPQQTLHPRPSDAAKKTLLWQMSCALNLKQTLACRLTTRTRSDTSPAITSGNDLV